MTPAACARAAALLLAARRRRQAIPALPAGCRPRDLAEAYAIQDALVAAAGGAPAGFKVAATSRAAQEYLGIEAPFHGRLFAAGVQDSPARLSRGGFIFALVEPEFAFRMGAALPARAAPYSRAEVAAAAASVHPAIEVVTCAFGEAWTRCGAPALAADNAVHGALVLGPGRADWRDLDLAAHPVRLLRNGTEAGAGTGANALGHPLDVLAWLANQGVRGGAGLAAGDVVTTGVVTPFLYAEAGEEFVADFAGLGEVRLGFSA